VRPAGWTDTLKVMMRAQTGEQGFYTGRNCAR
jgi:hypothetical protein